MDKTMHNNVVTNSIFYTAYKVLNVFFPLITSAYIARVLLSSGVGQVSYAQNIATYFTSLAVLGLPTYGTREIAKVRDNQSEQNKVFSELFSINFISTTICCIGYLGLILCIGRFRDNLTLYLVTGLAILLNYFNVDWLYQGREEYKYISIRSITIKTISTFLIFLIVRDKGDIIRYAFIHCFILAGNNLLNIIGLFSRVKLSIKGIEIRKHLKPLFVLFLSSIAIELYTLFDTTMLGFYCSDDDVGYYTYAMRVSKIIVAILVSIFAVLLPRLSILNYTDDKNTYSDILSKSLKIMGFVTMPCAIGLLLVSPQIIPILFGNDFLPAIPTLRILSMLAIPVSFNTFIGGIVFISRGMEKERLFAVCICAISNLAMNAVMIPLWAQDGAAIASLISEILVCVVEYLFLKKTMRVVFGARELLWVVLASFVMIIAVLSVQMIDISIFFKLALSVITGASVFLIFNLIVKNQTLFLMLSKMMPNRFKIVTKPNNH